MHPGAPTFVRTEVSIYYIDRKCCFNSIVMHMSLRPGSGDLLILLILAASGYWLLATEQRCIVLPVRYELNLYMLRRRK
jgi:hypothetical protein